MLQLFIGDGELSYALSELLCLQLNQFVEVLRLPRTRTHTHTNIPTSSKNAPIVCKNAPIVSKDASIASREALIVNRKAQL